MIRHLIILAIAALFVSCQTNVPQLKEAEQLSMAIGRQYAPDSREELFQMHFSIHGSALVVSGETTNSEAKKALLASLNRMKQPVIDSIQILPDHSLGAKNWGLVNVSVCNIRTTPAHSSEMSSQAILGTPVKLLKKQGSWILIQTPDRYLGWVDDDALFQTDSAGMADWRAGKRIIYLPLSGNAVNPETKEAVTDLVAGSILKLVEVSKTSTVLEMPDGRNLEIPAGDGMDFDLWKNNPAQTADKLILTSKKLMGRPYLWGGTSTKGIDCSGFVKTVFYLNGIILARDASLQFRHGAFTDPLEGYTKLKPGDLVFFGRKATGDKPARATHVGLYLGESAYINSSGYVKIDSFDPNQKNFSKIRTDNWLGSRTILGSEGVRGIVRVKDHVWY